LESRSVLDQEPVKSGFSSWISFADDVDLEVHGIRVAIFFA
jgi:hypothetical protein